jgi:hypothetical protein
MTEMEHIAELERGVAAQLKQAGWHDHAERHEKVAHDCDEAHEIRELTQAWETRQ